MDAEAHFCRTLGVQIYSLVHPRPVHNFRAGQAPARIAQPIIHLFVLDAALAPNESVDAVAPAIVASIKVVNSIRARQARLLHYSLWPHYRFLSPEQVVKTEVHYLWLYKDETGWNKFAPSEAQALETVFLALVRCKEISSSQLLTTNWNCVTALAMYSDECIDPKHQVFSTGTLRLTTTTVDLKKFEHNYQDVEKRERKDSVFRLAVVNDNSCSKSFVCSKVTSVHERKMASCVLSINTCEEEEKTDFKQLLTHFSHRLKVVYTIERDDAHAILKEFASHYMLHDFAETPDADSLCSICLEDYVTQKPIKLLNCPHHFHKNCVLQYIRSMVESTVESIKCPICSTKQLILRGQSPNAVLFLNLVTIAREQFINAQITVKPGSVVETLHDVDVSEHKAYVRCFTLKGTLRSLLFLGRLTHAFSKGNLLKIQPNGTITLQYALSLPFKRSDYQSKQIEFLSERLKNAGFDLPEHKKQLLAALCGKSVDTDQQDVPIKFDTAFLQQYTDATLAEAEVAHDLELIRESENSSLSEESSALAESGEDECRDPNLHGSASESSCSSFSEEESASSSD